MARRKGRGKGRKAKSHMDSAYTPFMGRGKGRGKKRK